MGLALLGGMPRHAQAQDFWDLFKPARPNTEATPAPKKQAMPAPGAGGAAGSYSTTPPWLEPRSRPVERADLSPAIADGSGLPVELWRGVEIKSLEAALAEIESAPRSPELHAAVAAHAALLGLSAGRNERGPFPGAAAGGAVPLGVAR